MGRRGRTGDHLRGPRAGPGLIARLRLSRRIRTSRPRRRRAPSAGCARAGSAPGRPRARAPPRPRRTARAGQHVRAHRAEQVVAGQPRVVADRVERHQRGLRAVGVQHRDRAVELDHRRRRQLGERVVERDDRLPVGVLERAGPAWQAAIAACTVYGPRGRPSLIARSSGREPVLDQRAVPARPVLVLEQDGAPPSPRASNRDACSSISATRPCTSGSRGSSPASTRPSRIASSARSRRTQRRRRSPRTPR